jgi:hypothetical protein
MYNGVEKNKLFCIVKIDASLVWWSEFLTTDPEVAGSFSGTTRFY